jgi:ribulose 1,5-bisphosphate carboxylase large subunit-like protein
MRFYSTISEADIDSDSEYNFALTPFTQLLDGVHWLVTTPLIMVNSLMKLSTARFQDMREEHSYKRSFKGPVCMLK